MTTAVAIALYNGEKFIYKQLESIRTQTQEPDQVVLCDDGSTDNTISIVNEYIEKYHLQNKWKLVKNDKNLGYARNFYKAMSMCTADLIFLGDQDDIWKRDKIESMMTVMEKNSHIDLLSCKFEIMDCNDNIMRGILAPKVKETLEISEVTTADLLRGFYWLGMLMCIRKSFWEEIKEQIGSLSVSHDRVLSHCAASKHSFYEYAYVGAYHRRHDNNTEREEHRIFKLLDVKRKLVDIEAIKKVWSSIIEADLPLHEVDKNLIEYRLELLVKREKALSERNFMEIIRLHRSDSQHLLRITSFVCDCWLILFGKYK